MVFLHGTSYEKAMEIIQNRFIVPDNNQTVWNCSNSGYIYCRKKGNKDAEYLTKEDAITNAAFHDSQTTIIAVISIEMDENIAEQIVKNDYSCPIWMTVIKFFKEI